MECRLKYLLRACLLLISAGVASNAGAQALGAWMPGGLAQSSADPPLVAATPTIGATTNGPGSFISFGHNSSYQVWATFEPGGTNSVLGYFSNNPTAAISWGANNASVFFSAQPPYANKAITVMTWNGSSWQWNNLGGDVEPNQRVAVVSWGVGHMAVFYRGTNRKLYVKQYSGSWQSSWTELGTGLRGDPVATTMGPNTMAVCAARDGSAQYTRMACRVYQNGSWGGWATVVDSPYVPVSYQVVSSLPGQFTVISPDSTYTYAAKRWNGTQFDAYSYGMPIPSSAKILDAISRGQGGINLVWRLYSTYSYQSKTYEMGYPLHHAWTPDGASWQTAEVGTPAVLGARLVSPAPNRVDLFADGVTCTDHCTHAYATHIYAIGDPNQPPGQQTSTVDVTIGGFGPTWGFRAGTGSGYYGSVSPSATVTGKTYSEIYDWYDYWGGGMGNRFRVCGFTSNPGSGWLVSLTTPSIQKTPATGSYEFDPAAGCATWLWSGTFLFGTYYGGGVPVQQLTIVHN